MKILLSVSSVSPIIKPIDKHFSKSQTFCNARKIFIVWMSKIYNQICIILKYF